jgi:hypothetical protein
MPVTPFQAKIAGLLAVNRNEGSYLAGGAALHFEPNSIRYSQDLNYFHASEIKVAEAYAADFELLVKEGIEVQIEMRQPGYIRVIARSGKDATKIEWAHDSAWRFMPTQYVEGRGFTLHPIDLAINKVLALAGRDEPRDYLDVMHAHSHILPVPGMIWAACGKDPGFTPHSLLELLQRKGKYRDEDFNRLRLNKKIDLQDMKTLWLEVLDRSQQVCNYLPAAEVGCLYYDQSKQGFIVPDKDRSDSVVLHYGRDGGILPRIN